MITKRVGKITLAITLIGAGLLLLAEKFLTIPFRDVFKFWPLLLIALGAEMIFSVFLYGRKPDVRLKYDRIAVLAAVIFSLVASGVSNSFGFSDFGPQLMLDGIKYKHSQSETFEKDRISEKIDVTQVVVDSSFGDIILEPASEKSIRVEASATLHYNDEKAGASGLEKIISITEGKTTYIKVASPDSFTKNAFSRTKLKLTVYVPAGVSIQASNAFGSIEATNLDGKVTLVNKHGKLVADNIRGILNAENSFGDIEINNISGDVKSVNRNGGVKISDINGNLDASNNFGNMSIESISGNVSADGGNGAITVSDIRKNVTVINSFGKINVSDISGDADLKNANGAIELQDADGNIHIKSSFGSVLCESNRLDNARLSLKTSFGKIEPVNGVSPVESSSSSSLETTFGAGAYQIQIENSNGDIVMK